MYVIAYDIGTTGLKTCLYSIEDRVSLVAGTYQEYDLCSTTMKLIEKTVIAPAEIKGLSFCSQMQGLVLADDKANALRRPMSYMDQRASKIMKSVQGRGLTVSGVNIVKLIKSLVATHAASRETL